MGKFFNRVKQVGNKISEKANEMAVIDKGPVDYEDFDGINDDFEKNNPGEDFLNYQHGGNSEQTQKPESFFHFLLANQYRDLELLIRGLKLVFNKKKNKMEIKRKDRHCFTDEEAEHIVRLAESHLSTDIKLSYISLTVFPIKMLAIKESLDESFYTLADYKYGRYGSSKNQMFMKYMNHDILVVLIERIQGNYSRAIKGAENRSTHNSVKGQESLNNTDRDLSGYGGESYL